MATGQQQQPQLREKAPGDLEPLATLFPLQGLNTWQSKFVLEHNVLTDLRNVDWRRIKDAMSLSKGRENHAVGLAAAVLGLGRFTAASGVNPRSVAVLNEGTVSWKIIDDAGVVSAVTLPIAWSSAQTRFASFAKKNIIIGTNAATRPLKLRKDNLTAATRVGIDTPATAPAVVVGAAGVLNGKYQWRVTFESPTHENSPGPVSAQLTLVSQQASLTAVPTSPDTQVTKRNIYRIGGTVPEWLFVGAINDNVTTIFTDNIADTALGAVLGFDRDPPRNTIHRLLEHKQRLFGTDGNELLVSNYQEPEGWDARNTFPVGGSSNIFNLGTTGSILLLIKDVKTWGLFGESLADFVLLPLFNKGTLSGDSVVSTEGLVVWLADDSTIRASDGKEHWNIGEEVQGLLDSLTLAQKRTAVGGFAGGYIFMSFPGQFTLGYDLFVKRWTVWPWTYDQIINAFDENGLAQIIITDGASSTNLRRWPGPYTDLGAAVVWRIERDLISPKQIAGTKAIYRYRDVEIISPPQAGLSVTLEATIDGDITNKFFTKSIDLTDSPVRVGLPPRMVGKTCKIKISGSHSAVVEIHGIILWGYVERPYGKSQ